VALIAVGVWVIEPEPAMLPVTLPVKAPIKPLVEVTGPEKVVDAMIFPYMQVMRLSACRQLEAKLSDALKLPP
jgi:hypothetical protein